ncbi:MAG: DNA primase [Spirochaetaceae bacterium]|jgi:DNA primase|nr:DNA primase [Spirochaetaceae bacterium]
MARIADATIQELNDKLDAVGVVNDYVRLDKRSGRYWGCCPFHNEKTPSFTVNPDRKLYYCFGCHKGGTIIDFVMEMDKLSFVEAVEVLAKKTGIEIIYDYPGNVEQDRQIAARKDELFELYRRVAGSFFHILTEKPEGEAALAYVLDRGISRKTLEKFRLGFSPADRSWLSRFLRGKGYTGEFLASSGLFSQRYPGSPLFSGRLMFPIADRQGRIVAFGGRVLPGAGEGAAGAPKYINSPESEIYKKGQTLFAIDLAIPEIRRTREAYIAEGYMDVIALHEAGISNAAAPLGTAFTDDQAKLLRRWAERINLLFDTDEAGQNAAVKAILTCRRNGLSVSVVEGGSADAADLKDPVASKPADAADLKDPADILKYLGAEALQKRAKCIIIDFEYLLRRGRTLFDISTSGGKAQAVAFMFPYLETLDSEVSRDTCIGDIADVFGVERQAVFDDYHHSGRGNAGNGHTGLRQPGGIKSVKMNDELFLLVVVLVNPSLVPKLRSNLSIEELTDPGAKELFIALEEWFRNSAPGEREAALPHDLLSRIQDEALRTFVIEQGASGAFSTDPGALFEDSMRQVKRKRLERRQTEIIIELRSQRRGTAGVSPDDLLAEKVLIDAELQKFKEATE